MGDRLELLGEFDEGVDDDRVELRAALIDDDLRGLGVAEGFLVNPRADQSIVTWTSAISRPARGMSSRGEPVSG